jgi:hypothetical protein
VELGHGIGVDLTRSISAADSGRATSRYLSGPGDRSRVGRGRCEGVDATAP